VFAAWLGLMLSLAVLGMPGLKDREAGLRQAVAVAIAIAASILAADVAIPH
jgi:hypothetical protein